MVVSQVTSCVDLNVLAMLTIYKEKKKKNGTEGSLLLI